MAKYKLFGNGIDDDYPAIQEMLDSGASEVVLPAPEKMYLISKTLKIHGGQCLKLGRFTTIRLMDNSNCAMLEDEDFMMFKENICVDGGIWDFNGINQVGNPHHFAYGEENKTSYERLQAMNFPGYKEAISLPDTYTGFCMRFCRITNLILKNITFKNPVCYAVDMTWIHDFTVSDIIFDYYAASPKLWNMDGIHVEGNCKNGVIRNLKGACHDDLVALTADDGGTWGPIENIVIDGIFSQNTHSAIRLLSHGEPLRNITITNVYSSSYRYAIGLTKYHGGPEERGVYENITIENCNLSNCEGTPDVRGAWAPILIQNYIDIDNLVIRNISRTENYSNRPTVELQPETTVNNMVLDNIHLYNKTNGATKPLLLQGKIKHLTKKNIFVDGKKVR